MFLIYFPYNRYRDADLVRRRRRRCPAIPVPEFRPHLSSISRKGAVLVEVKWRSCQVSKPSNQQSTIKARHFKWNTAYNG